jgi:hypothetical protein
MSGGGRLRDVGSYAITLGPIGDTVVCRREETVLSAILRSGAKVVFGCRGGGCGTCKMRLLSGQGGAWPLLGCRSLGGGEGERLVPLVSGSGPQRSHGRTHRNEQVSGADGGVAVAGRLRLLIPSIGEDDCRKLRSRFPHESGHDHQTSPRNYQEVAPNDSQRDPKPMT